MTSPGRTVNLPRRRARFADATAVSGWDFTWPSPRLAVLGERQAREKVADEYLAWCNRWGSPGLLGFLFSPAGIREGEWYLREKRTGALLSETEFFARYPEAELGDRRYREPVRIDDLSREISLFRDVLLLCTQLRGDEADDDDDEIENARAALLGELRGDEVGSPQRPDYQQGFYVREADRVLWRWLWVHARGGRLSFTDNPRSKSYETVWAFDSFIDGLYHLLLEDITTGQKVRRCADRKCRVFFRPKRGGAYHDERCRRRSDTEMQNAKVKEGLALQDKGETISAIAARFKWSEKDTARRLSKAADQRSARMQERTLGNRSPREAS